VGFLPKSQGNPLLEKRRTTAREDNRSHAYGYPLTTNFIGLKEGGGRSKEVRGGREGKTLSVRRKPNNLFKSGDEEDQKQV